QPDRDLAFDADADIVGGRKLRPAVVHALLEHTAAAWMRDADVLLHDLAGAADLVADERPEMRQQEIMQRALDLVALSLVGRRNLQRRERRMIAARQRDRLCGCKNFVHWCRLPRIMRGSGASRHRP